VRTEQSQLEARYDGVVKLESTDVVKREKHYIVMNRHGEIVIQDETGRERERYGLTYGAKLYFNDGEKVKQGPAPLGVGSVLGADRHRGERRGEVRRRHRGRHHDRAARRGHRPLAQEHHREQGRRPAAAHLAQGRPGEDAQDPQRRERGALLPAVGATIAAAEGDRVEAGDIIARIPRETTKTEGHHGRPCRAWPELFESRKPEGARRHLEIDGTSASARTPRASARVIITPDKGEPKEFLISKGKHLSVREGDKIHAGEPLMDGAANPHDILRVLGEKALAKYLVDEVQEVYRPPGREINDKHIEVIVRQMLRRVRVVDVGDTNFLVDEHVEKYIFEEENEKVISKGGKPAQGEPLLLGITKASLSTESFISASSFQETTKVLTEAAVCGKVDLPARPQGERDHGPADSGRDGPRQVPEHRDPDRGARGARLVGRRRARAAARRERPAERIAGLLASSGSASGALES
jgi:DNA-directed RNA polymerase subunit beta'